MAGFEHSEGYGSLFRNQKKKTDKHPDYTGSVNIGGTVYWLSGWLKNGRNGKFLSLAAQPKDDQGERPRGNGQAEDRDEPF